MLKKINIIDDYKEAFVTIHQVEGINGSSMVGV